MAASKKEKSNKKDPDVELGTLKPLVARRVLLMLLAKRPELEQEMIDIARGVLINPLMEDLSAEIGAAIGAVSAGDVYMNSGRHRGSFREPEEVAAELLSEPLEPYFREMEEHLQRGNEHAALVRCEAIILALYRLQQSDGFKEIEVYAADFPEETAGWAARLWLTASKPTTQLAESRRTSLAKFVRDCVPEWDWLLEQSFT